MFGVDFSQAFDFKGFAFIKTCEACPEQYDVFKNKNRLLILGFVMENSESIILNVVVKLYTLRYPKVTASFGMK